MIIKNQNVANLLYKNTVVHLDFLEHFNIVQNGVDSFKTAPSSSYILDLRQKIYSFTLLKAQLNVDPATMEVINLQTTPDILCLSLGF